MLHRTTLAPTGGGGQGPEVEGLAGGEQVGRQGDRASGDGGWSGQGGFDLGVGEALQVLEGGEDFDGLGHGGTPFVLHRTTLTPHARRQGPGVEL